MEPKSDIQNRIILMLELNNTARYTELKNALGVSKPVLSYHLKVLRDARAIEFEKKGREKHYRLSKKAPGKLERCTPILAGSYIRSYFEFLDQKKNEKPVTIYEEIGKKINALFLYTILTSFMRGENWFNAFDSKGMGIVTINYLIYTLFEKHGLTSKELPLIFSKNLFDVHFNQLQDIISKKKMDKSLKEMMNTLKKIYPDEVRFLDEVISGFKS